MKVEEPFEEIINQVYSTENKLILGDIHKPKSTDMLARRPQEWSNSLFDENQQK